MIRIKTINLKKILKKNLFGCIVETGRTGRICVNSGRWMHLGEEGEKVEAQRDDDGLHQGNDGY